MLKKTKSKSLFLFLFLVFFPNLVYIGIDNRSFYILPSNQGEIGNQEQKIFWFTTISDTQFLWYDGQKIAQFNRFLNESYGTIKPSFIYHTGDIVDSDNGNQQHVEEWQRYNQSLMDKNINSSFYMDIMGNHDSVKDPSNTNFLNYSVMGSTYATSQYSFNRTFSFGDYAFIGLNTAKDQYIGGLDFAFIGYLDSQELDWYENELTKYKNCDGIYTFGHHILSYPPFNTLISEESSSGKTFFQLNEEYNVKCYFAGHAHVNYHQMYYNTFSIVTDNFDEYGGTYRIISVDNNQISSSIEYVGSWPQGIITSPPRKDYPNDNTPQLFEDIRVLAWDPLGVNSVAWAIFNNTDDSQMTDWRDLTRFETDSPLWQGTFNFYQRGNYTLKALINVLSEK